MLATIINIYLGAQVLVALFFGRLWWISRKRDVRRPTFHNGNLVLR